MFTSALKTFLSKPTLASPALKSALLASKTPFQAALLQRSFARNFQKTQNRTDQPEIITPVQTTVPPVTGPTVDTLIRQDLNLNKFMSRIYSTTGLSIAGSLGFSYALAMGSSAVVASPFLALFGGLAMSIGGIVAMGRIPPQIVVEKDVKGKMVEKWTNSLGRKLAFSSIIAGSGIMLAPFMKGLIMINPAIIPMAAGLSIFTMGGSSLYAMYKPLGQFKAWESTLYGTLLGLIGMNVCSLLVAAAIGPNIFSLACSRVDMYVGLGLFAAFQAMDTQLAVQAYQDGNYDHLQHVVNFFLNFKNIFIRIASILSELRGD